jgi:tetratricopeptide (TPR) repeat protein
MDWITLLRSLQADFIKRLTSGCLLHCETEGQHSELTIISGERLRALREFCWQMAEKYKRTSQVRDVFISNLKGKLGEEVVKERLADFVTEIDYEKRFGGDGKVDFTLTFDSSVGISVKSRHGSFNKVRWSISSEEVQKNAVVVCILIKEEVNEAQPEYHLFLAGFLPTQMIKLRTGKISIGVEQLLYCGGLRCYLEQLQTFSVDDFPPKKQPQMPTYIPKLEPTYQQLKQPLPKPLVSPSENSYSPSRQENLNPLYIRMGDDYFEKGQYDTAIATYNEALQLNPKDVNTYYKRGLARYYLGDYEGAISDYTQALQINPYYGKVYAKIGMARYSLGDYEGAIADYNQAIRLNPNDAIAYKNRADVRSQIGDTQGAFEDYTQAIKINPTLLKDKQRFPQKITVNPHDAASYKKRGNSRAELGDYEGAIEDYSQAIKLNRNDADAYYHRGNYRYDLGDYLGAIEDYNQVIKLKPNDAEAYYNRGNSRYNQGDKQAALEDFQKAADIYRKEGKLDEHKNVREIILDLEIEESLDILNF